VADARDRICDQVEIFPGTGRKRAGAGGGGPCGCRKGAGDLPSNPIPAGPAGVNGAPVSMCRAARATRPSVRPIHPRGATDGRLAATALSGSRPPQAGQMVPHVSSIQSRGRIDKDEREPKGARITEGMNRNGDQGVACCVRIGTLVNKPIKSICRLVGVLTCDAFSPFDRKPHSRRTHFQPDG